MTTGLPAACLPGIGFVPLLIGAQQSPGLHRCSQTTVWWSFIAVSSVSKSLLLSSLFWFMYSLIYLCMWTRGGEKRWGMKKGGGVGRGRQRQLQCLLLYPRERLRYICLLKASATDKHSAAAERYKALSVAPKPPTPSQPPSWVNRHCMHVLYAQTKKVFFQLRPSSVKRVKRCCVEGITKPKARGKKRAGSYCCFRILRKQERSDQSRDFAHNMPGFHLPLPVSVTGGGKPLEGSGRTGTEEQTNLLRKESGLQRLHSHKERVSRWDVEPVASPLFITYIKQIS